MIIAIDGTSASGKSSIAKALGARLGFAVVGTGSIYRAITLKLLNLNIKANEDERIQQIINTTHIEVDSINGATIINVDDIEQKKAELNSREVSNFSPLIAMKPYIREFVRKIQRSQAEIHENIIVEGRDIGSVVFPNADLKFFIDADITTRAQRRQSEYLEKGKNYSLDAIVKELSLRDQEDREREISPLVMTSDSIIFDTSRLSIEECVDQIVNIINDRKLQNA